MNHIEQYYEKIKNKEIIVSKKVEKVYRHLIHELSNDSSCFYFDDAKAEYAIQFIEKFCKHSKGKMGGKPFILELWQKAIVSAVFGFVHKKTKLRKYRELILLVARKNGKSALASAIALYMLFADNEKGAEIYSVATKREQAKIIWQESKSMIAKSAELKKRSKSYVAEIKFQDSVFRPLASDSNSLDGLNVHCSLIDELHAITDKNLYDVIIDGMTAREQPLSVITSTAGTVRECIFDLKYDEAERIINEYENREHTDERVLPIIYELDSKNEWTDEKCWQKANPGLGTIKSFEQLKDKVKKAKSNSLLVKNLICKDFNIIETATEAFLSFEQLQNKATFDIEKIGARYGIGGVDLSKTTDLTCATILFRLSEEDKTIYVHQKYWMPEDLIEKRKNEDKIDYEIWKKQGWLDTCEGNTIDYKLITQWFLEMQNQYDITLYKCGYDSWSANYFVEDMTNEFGKNVMEAVKQVKKTLSLPLQNLAADLDKKIVNYNNNPILKWCLANVSIETDKNGNIQPCKYNQRKRIDGFASMLDAYVVYHNHIEEYMSII